MNKDKITTLREKYKKEGKELASIARRFKETDTETYNFFMGQVCRTVDMMTDLEELLK